MLTIFLGFTALGLNSAFKASYDVTQHQQLKNHIYMLLTAAEFTESGTLVMPDSLAEPAFSTPNSGLYAQIFDQYGAVVWHSGSLLGRTINVPTFTSPRQSFQASHQQEHLSELTSGQDKLLNLAYRVIWENKHGNEYDFTLHVSQDLKASQQAKNEFMFYLWSWLGGAGLALLLIQILILRWSLKPLSEVAEDLWAIENGVETRLAEHYPLELNRLTRNINALLDQEQSRRQRYKNALADLGHSLKTPLTILQNELNTGENRLSGKRESDIQIAQIIKSIDYQLHRAGTQGRSTLQGPVMLSPLLNKITASLDKVYQDKQVNYHSKLDLTITLSADEGDLYELFGNVLENAYKYCKNQVITHMVADEAQITVYIDNDSEGIPKEAQNDILKRGMRMDTQTEGQGLGLAIASDIVFAYQGDISLTESQLGGACFMITLPRR